MSVRILIGDVRDRLKDLPDESVHCVVTSPPYFALRDYGVAGQIGLEATWQEHVATMVEVFREVRRVLRSDGTCWVNYGDSYATSANGRSAADTKEAGHDDRTFRDKPFSTVGGVMKPKDLMGIPWRVALALQEPYYTGRIKNIEDRIWLAAMIDGEGCMFIHKRKAGSGAYSKFTKKDGTVSEYSRTQDTYGAGLEVANCSRAITDKCLAITGKGSIFKHEKDRRQPLYRWQLRSNECREIVREIYPHLVAKQHQARLLLSCPSSGPKAEAAHASLIALHNGLAATIDFPEPASMYEPGWYLRQDVIWAKNNPMPESIRDRCTKAHEYVFLLSKSRRYFFDAEAISEAAIAQDMGAMDGGAQRLANGSNANSGRNFRGKEADGPLTRNRRSVWTIATAPFSEAHFATFPPELPELCIKAGSKPGDTILDPFFGAGTTGMVADRLQRHCIGIELNPEYAAMAEKRIKGDRGALLDYMMEAAE